MRSDTIYDITQFGFVLIIIHSYPARYISEGVAEAFESIPTYPNQMAMK
jgi:hypothetical protein